MKVGDVKIENFHSVLHMSFDKYHTSESKGIISCPNSPIHGKTIWRESISYKNKHGEFFNSKRNKMMYYIEREKDSPIFNTFEELVRHYCKEVLED